jgi:hypothetical protein
MRRALLFFAFALASCHREVARSAAAVVENAGVADTQYAADTIVRRVMRVTRRPWMIQRATGVVRARRALEPLDSVLALRVLDQRGAELAGVRVRWTAVNPASGSRMEVINSITDSAGMSRVAFTPGLTANPQGVRAEVADVAGLDFLVRVPIAQLRVTPERAEIWSGESANFSVELRDRSGQVLSAGDVAWKSRDTSTVSVASPSIDGAVLGRFAGITEVTASADSARDTVTVLVKPVLDARFITIDGSPAPAALTLQILSGSSREPISPARGRYSGRVDVPLYSSVDLWTAPAPSDSAFHPVRISVAAPRDLQGLTIALIPRSWRIDAGSYAGRTVRIDAGAALRRAPTSAGFWRVAPVRGNDVRQLLGWHADAFPLRLAFDRRRSAEAVSAADSVAFWAIAEQMQLDLGARLFLPADLPAEWRGGEVIPLEVGTGSAEGNTDVTWSEHGDAYDAVLSFRRAATLRDAHVVTHELLHLLGFGHTSEWRSIVTPGGGGENRLSPEDVAYTQLAMRLRALYDEHGARPGLPVSP